jgi:hypothetical protein
MRPFAISLAVVTLATVRFLSLHAGAAGGQTGSLSTNRAAAAVNIPRTADGRPDLDGNWNFSTLTPLERPDEFAGRERLTEEEVSRLEGRATATQFTDNPPKPGDPGAYNRFWTAAGTRVAATRRTSLVIDPPDGRVPALTPEGQKREDTRALVRHEAAGPEALPPWDRCLLGFNAGPPIIPSGYNNMMQLVQTDNYVVILTEMVHDARIIPLDGTPRLPRHVRQWKGDSRGRWEGDTLVIESSNFTDQGTGTLPLDPEFRRRGLGLTPDGNLRLVERLTRLNATTLLYTFTIDDPTIWTRPWTVEVPMTKTDEQLYEYACHEGNYGLGGILRGARAAEKAPSK